MKLGLKHDLLASTSPATSQLTLSALGATVRAELKAIGHNTSSALAHALTLGGALHKAKLLAGHGHWADWLNAECGLSPRSARIYIELFDNREFLKEKLAPGKRQHAADFDHVSIRAALRLIKGTGKRVRKPRQLSSLKITAWQSASPDQRTMFFGRIPTAEIIGALTPAQRIEIESHLNGQITSLKVQVTRLRKQVEMSVPIVPFKTKRAA